jgi:hypothetical protein
MADKVNEYQLKISGKCSLPQPLVHTSIYNVIAEIQIEDITKRNNHDGTIDIIYKGVLTGKLPEIENEKKEIMYNK